MLCVILNVILCAFYYETGENINLLPFSFVKCIQNDVQDDNA